MVNQGSRLPSANRPTSKSRVDAFVGAAILASLVSVALPATAAPSAFRKGPYLQDLSTDSVSIRWELDPPAPATVEITSPNGEIRRFPVTMGAAFASVRVPGLTPKTAYRYRVVPGEPGAKTLPPDAGVGSVEGAFTTAPPTSETSLRFVVYGDNRSDDAAHSSVVRAMAKAEGEFLVNTGDLVEDGSNEIDWQHFFEIERPILRDRALFASIGNHELVETGGGSFLRYFGEEVDGGAAPPGDRRRFARSLRWGSARFLFVNAMDSFATTEERKWLDAELARIDQEPGLAFRFVVLHQGPYSSGPHGPNPRMWNTGLVEALREHRIDLVFCGHDHLYERGEAKGLKYVVSGGGGAPLYPVKKRLASSPIAESAHHFIEVSIKDQSFAMVARRVDGSVLDRCGFAKGGGWDCDKPAPKAPEPSQPPIKEPPPASRCGCDVPGARSAADALIAVGLAAIVLVVRRRRARAA